MNTRVLSLTAYCFALTMLLMSCSNEPRAPLASKHKGEQFAYTRNVETLLRHVEHTVSDEDVVSIKRALQQTIAQWRTRSKLNDLRWSKASVLSDKIIFNSDKTKALLLYQHLPDERPHRTVKLIAGKKRDGQWLFNERGLPNFTYGYDEKRRNGVPFTQREVIFRTLNTLAEDGLLRFGRVQDDYFGKWVAK